MHYDGYKVADMSHIVTFVTSTICGGSYFNDGKLRDANFEPSLAAFASFSCRHYSDLAR